MAYHDEIQAMLDLLREMQDRLKALEDQQRRRKEAADIVRRVVEEAKRLSTEELRTKRERKEQQQRYEWNCAWDRYRQGWAQIQPNGCDYPSIELCWPTKSGKRCDVTDKAVREFFENHLAVAKPNLAAERAAGSRPMLRLECLRWHPDKLAAQFGKDLLESSDKEEVATVCRTVILLYKEAKPGSPNS